MRGRHSVRSGSWPADDDHGRHGPTATARRVSLHVLPVVRVRLPVGEVLLRTLDDRDRALRGLCRGQRGGQEDYQVRK